jgi:hypothetical protein
VDIVKGLNGEPIPKEDLDRHGLRSAEHSLGAFEEGFAHFIASVAFNPVGTSNVDGIFHYYKDVNVDMFNSYQDLKDNLYMVSLKDIGDLGGGRTDGQIASVRMIGVREGSALSSIGCASSGAS